MRTMKKKTGRIPECEAVDAADLAIAMTIISKKDFCPGAMAVSEWMCSFRAVRDTPVADYSKQSVNTARRIAYCPPIAVSPFLLALLVSCFELTLWRCGQL